MPNISQHVDVNGAVGTAPASKFSFARAMIVFEHAVTANRVDGPYTSLAEVVAAGFTSAAEPEIHAAATAFFSQDDGADELFIGREDAGDASLTVTLDAIEAAESEPAYFFTIASRLDADIALAAAWAEARSRFFIGQSDDLAAAAMIAAQTASYNRTAIIYHDADAEYLDVAWMSSGAGQNLDSPDGAGTWKYRQLDGIDFAALTPAQATAITDANGNFFGRLKGLSFTQEGTAASGRFIDVTTSSDWFAFRVEEGLLTLFVNANKIPFTDGGINLITTEIEDVAARGVLFGHIAPGTFVLDPITLATVSAADRAARCLQLTGSFRLAGAVHKVTFDFTVQL